MEIVLYGTRGSISAPLRNAEYREKVWGILQKALDAPPRSQEELTQFWESLPLHLKYLAGGDTTCVLVRSSAGNHYMVDCGTGGRVLGDDLMGRGFAEGKGYLNAFMTHTHWDHIQGLPFFKPLYIPGNQIHFLSPYSDLEERLSYQQDSRFFPVPFQSMGSTKSFEILERGKPKVFEDGIQVSFYPLKHPGGCVAYKFQEGDRSFIFSSDAEFTGEDMDSIRRMKSFFENADLLLLDSQYTLDESFNKFDWGHTSYTMAVNCASIWGVKNLALTHHEPAYPDKKVFSILDEALQHKKHLQSADFTIHLAREGMKFQL